MGKLLDKLFGPGRAVPSSSSAIGGTRPASIANIGMYQGNGLPQDPRSALVSQVLPTMSGAAGIRLGASTNRSNRYFGTDDMPPLRFPVTGAPGVNQQIDLETAAFKAN
jgi:hypothetical protein